MKLNCCVFYLALPEVISFYVSTTGQVNEKDYHGMVLRLPEVNVNALRKKYSVAAEIHFAAFLT